MSDYRVRVDGAPAEPAAAATVSWIDVEAGLARVDHAGRRWMVMVEGSGSDWHVTIAGRRVPVTVQTRREQLLADAEVASGSSGGPVEVKATLPGLIVAVTARPGAEVGEGDALLTIEAMKMQNEVRAPRGGRVTEVAVAAGQTVARGALLLRLE